MPDDTQITDDHRLIDQARASPAAFARLYRSHYDCVFHYCVHRLFDRATAEDVTAEVFVKMVEHFADFTGDLHGFRCWLFKIATNTINTHLRRQGRQQKLLVNHADQLAKNNTNCRDQQAENLELLRQAMLSLKVRYQTVITLRYFENMKLTDVADILGSSPGTVRSQLKRALAQLRRRMTTLANSACREVT